MFLALSCEAGEAGAPTPGSEAVGAPEIAIAGCIRRTAQLCTRRTNQTSTGVHVWVDLETSATVQVLVDGAAVQTERQTYERGDGLVFEVPTGSASIELKGLDPPWTSSHQIALQWSSPPLELWVINRLAAAGTPPAVTRSMLESAAATRDDEAGLVLLHRLAQAQRNSDPDAFAQTSAELERRATELDVWYDFAKLSLASAYVALANGDPARTRALLNMVARLPDLPVELRNGQRYHRARLAMETGDFASAERALARVQRDALRVADYGRYISSLQERAVALGEMGRDGETAVLAARGYAALDNAGVGCQLRAQSLSNLGWAELRATSNQDAESARLAFQAALAASTEECPNPRRAADQRLHLALTALREGEFEESLRWIAELRAGAVPPALLPWVQGVQARALALTGQSDALPSPLLEPHTTSVAALDWSAALERGRRLYATGLFAAAAEAYARADAISRGAAAALGDDLSEEVLLAGRSSGSDGLVAALLADGRPTEALCRARLARRRTLAKVDRAAKIASLSPERRAYWERTADTYLASRRELAVEAKALWGLTIPQRRHRLSRHQERLAAIEDGFSRSLRTVLGEQTREDCDSLSPIPASTALLLVAPGDDAVAVFIADDHGVSGSLAASIDTKRPLAWSAAALAPYADRLRRATQIRIVASGAARELPWPKVQVDGVALLDVAPLVHSLDIAPRPSAPSATSVLVVGNPTHDLPLAQHEATYAENKLSEAGWTTDLLLGQQVSHDAMLERVGDVDLLYYAGHGVSRGTAGWAGALVLADGELTVSQILALPKSPPRAVLAGCDTGSLTTNTLSGGMNLGRAFVLAGTREVLVSRGTADEHTARQLGEGLVDALVDTPDISLGQGLQRTQQTLRRQQPQGSWWRFDVIVP